MELSFHPVINLTKVEIPHHCWYDDKPLELTFPDEWKVHLCKVASEDVKTMTPEQIKAAIANPVSQKPLAKLAEGAEEVVIIFDDMTRPTKTFQYAPFILETLHEAGIPEDNIRFIIAPGTHGTYGRRDFVKKLGDEIVSNYAVYNHNPYDIIDYLGKTELGTPVWVNSEVMACDLKIGIGTVLFHRLTGLSGGGKMISPGVAGMETIKYNHGEIGGFGPGLTPCKSTGYLMNEDNRMRMDMEEAARVAGAGWLRTYVRIWVPLLMPTLVMLAMINFTLAVGATSSVILLASRDTQTLSIFALQLMGEGGSQWERSGIVSITLIVMTVGVSLLMRHFGLRLGVRHNVRAEQGQEAGASTRPAGGLSRFIGPRG